MTAETIRRLASARRDLMVRLRRDLHRIPEPANREYATTEYIEAFLGDLGIFHERATSGTGCVAVIGKGEDAVLLRADIDALPIEESTGAAYASSHPGMMHACGHDAHAAILLATADALASGELNHSGRVILLFQPAEEGQGGCRTLLRQGLLDRYRPKRAAALHVWPGLNCDTVGLTPGPIMAGVNHVAVEFTGPGGHGALPQATADTVAAASHFVASVQAALSRRLDPLASRVLTFGSIHGGSAPNIIPERVRVEGTMRWYDDATGLTMQDVVSEAATSSASLLGASCEVEIDEGYIPTVNGEKACEELSRVLRATLGEGRVVRVEPTMGAEDMGFILREVEGCYMRLGSGTVGPGAEPLHTARYLPGDECLETGLTALLSAVAAFAPA